MVELPAYRWRILSLTVGALITVRLRNESAVIVTALNRYQGVMGTDSPQTYCDNIILDGEFDTYEDGVSLYRVALSFRIFYRL